MLCCSGDSVKSQSNHTVPLCHLFLETGSPWNKWSEGRPAPSLRDESGRTSLGCQSQPRLPRRSQWSPGELAAEGLDADVPGGQRPHPSALGRLGPLLMRPASQVLVTVPTGHPFGESKASLLWQWHLEGQGLPCPGEPWGTWQLVGELPSPSPTQPAHEPASSHSPWGCVAPHLRRWLLSHPPLPNP